MRLISQPILQRVADFIAREQLLPPSNPRTLELSNFQTFELSNPSSPVFVGLSGGPDSVALLHILRTLGYACHALHCNFRLRGAESERDEQHCRQLCASMGVPLTVRAFDTRAYMAEHHLSLEMAARQLRYDWWHEVLSNPSNPSNLSNPNFLALGHHQDDSLETLLMNLMRGTGIHGLTGIVARNEARRVVRPLLCLSRQDILDYLHDNGLTYVTDSTNASDDTLRNQVRNQLLPLMEQMVPQVRQGIALTIRHLQGTEWFADRYLGLYDALTQHHSQWGLSWDELDIAEATRQFPQHLDDFLHHWEQQHTSPTGAVRVVRTPRLIYTTPSDAALFEQHRPQLHIQEEPFSPAVPTCQLSLADTRSSSPLQNRFDADTLTLPLTLRRWQQGDRIAPLGMKGHTKLVSDLFTDAHYTPMQKATTWLLCDATGSILWVIGLRMSELHKVTPATRRVVTIRCV